MLVSEEKVSLSCPGFRGHRFPCARQDPLRSVAGGDDVAAQNGHKSIFLYLRRILMGFQKQ